MPKIDDNSHCVVMGYNADMDAAVPFSIDNVTGYLRVSLGLHTGVPQAYAPTVDANNKGIAFGVDAAGTPRALITNTNGSLRCIE